MSKAATIILDRLIHEVQTEKEKKILELESLLQQSTDAMNRAVNARQHEIRLHHAILSLADQVARAKTTSARRDLISRLREKIGTEI